MKTLKITLALIAIAMLTVSGVKSENVSVAEKSDIQQPAKIDLLAHGKRRLKLPTQM